MEMQSATAIARRLMDKHGLTDWKIQVMHAKQTAGRCHHMKRTIQLSKPFFEVFTREDCIDTILHEIAHALVGPGHDHDHVWRAKAKSIGCNGKQYVSEESNRPKGKYIMVCPNGHTSYAHRKTSASTTKSCGQCSRTANPKYMMAFMFTDDYERGFRPQWAFIPGKLLPVITLRKGKVDTEPKGKVDLNPTPQPMSWKDKYDHGYTMI